MDKISNANVILQIIVYVIFSVPEQQRLTGDINPKSKRNGNNQYKLSPRQDLPCCFYPQNVKM
jgi:hypothetical protein